MGGYGSTRWGWHWKAPTVEDCPRLDVAQLERRGALGGSSVRFSYTVNGQTVNAVVELVTTVPGFGGKRRWFRCSCGSRRRLLYLPRGKREFACRSCYRLTYTSVQEHDKRIDRLARDPWTARAMMDSLIGEPGPALGAGAHLFLARLAAARPAMHALVRLELREKKRQAIREARRADLRSRREARAAFRATVAELVEALRS